MALKLSDLTKTTKTTSFEWEGEPVNLTFRPAALTPAMQLALSRLASPTDPEDTANQYAVLTEQTEDYLTSLATLFAGWDVLGEDGAPLAITSENLALLPWPFLGAAYTACQKANSPNAKTAVS